jgi:hypothetical protein
MLSFKRLTKLHAHSPEVTKFRKKKRIIRFGYPVIGGWIKLHNEQLHNLYSSPSIIRMIKSRMRWARHVARMRKRWSAYRVLVGKPEGKRPLVRPGYRWVDNTVMTWGGGVHS